MRFLLDTNVLAEMFRATPNRKLLSHFERHGSSSAISSVTWHEMLFGLRRLPSGSKRERLQAFLDEVVEATLPILPYDEPAAAWHATERARLEKRGIAVPNAHSSPSGSA